MTPIFRRETRGSRYMTASARPRHSLAASSPIRTRSPALAQPGSASRRTPRRDRRQPTMYVVLRLSATAPPTTRMRERRQRSDGGFVLMRSIGVELASLDVRPAGCNGLAHYTSRADSLVIAVC